MNREVALLIDRPNFIKKKRTRNDGDHVTTHVKRKTHNANIGIMFQANVNPWKHKVSHTRSRKIPNRKDILLSQPLTESV